MEQEEEEAIERALAEDLWRIHGETLRAIVSKPGEISKTDMMEGVQIVCLLTGMSTFSEIIALSDEEWAAIHRENSFFMATVVQVLVIESLFFRLTKQETEDPVFREVLDVYRRVRRLDPDRGARK